MAGDYVFAFLAAVKITVTSLVGERFRSRLCVNIDTMTQIALGLGRRFRYLLKQLDDVLPLLLGLIVGLFQHGDTGLRCGLCRDVARNRLNTAIHVNLHR
ncbi:hypothetical protein CCP4SC76_260001 [Gammaproteobacteria bacterium]